MKSKACLDRLIGCTTVQGNLSDSINYYLGVGV